MIREFSSESFRAFAKRSRPGHPGLITELPWAQSEPSLTGRGERKRKLNPEGQPTGTWVSFLSRGWDGFEELWQVTRASFPAEGPRAKSLNELRNSLGNHVSHMDYAERLQEGWSIGSGQIEHACKNMIGRHLKQTAARRRTRRLNRMAGLCSILDSHQWEA